MTIGSFSVYVHVYHSLNTNQSVILEPELLFSTKEELLDNLEDQNMLYMFVILLFIEMDKLCLLNTLSSPSTKLLFN